MMRVRKKVVTKKKSNAGTSMIEVLIAFLVVMVMMAMFAKVVTASVSLLRQSKDTITKTEKFDEKYYKTEERTKRVTVSPDLTLKISGQTSDRNTTRKNVELELTEGKLQKYTDDDTKLIRYTIYVEPRAVQPDTK